MDFRPPANLIELLSRLGVADEQAVLRATASVRRLAHGLPLVESVWVDALAQTGLLTSFQAAEIHAGRGAQLRLGPYLLQERLTWPAYATSHRAVEAASGRSVLLLSWPSAAASPHDLAKQTETMRLDVPGLAPVEALGSAAGRRFAAVGWIDGCPASQWVLHHGRLPPHVVWELARRMLQTLLVLEKAGLAHGDVSPHSLILAPVGNVVLLAPGLRGLVRPTEGYSHAELRPEAYEFLAPERITDGASIGLLSDIYSCGCLWWHLLTGRPPVPGGDSLGKLRAVEVSRLVDVRQWAPDVPAALAQTISACTQRDPRRRPDSIARLAAVLGEPASDGQRILREAILLRAPNPSPLRGQRQSRQRQELSARITVALTLFVALASLAGLGWTAKRAWFSNPDTGLITISGKKGIGPVLPPGSQDKTTQERPTVPTPPHGPRMVDPQVVPAAASVTETARAAPPAQQQTAPRSGKRQTINVPLEGWPIADEKATIEDVDFRWTSPALGESRPAEPGPLVRCAASDVTFLRCTFRVTPTGGPRPAAIRWVRPANARAADVSLPSGRVTLIDCVFHGVDAAIDGRLDGATAIRVQNTAHLGGGPFLRWHRYPNADEPIQITLSRMTLRDAGPLLACDVPSPPAQPGALAFRASQCVFVPRPDTPMILFRSPQVVVGLWAAFRWMGDGSLLAPKTPMAVWRDDRGESHPLDDSSSAIAGLVRGGVAFAGLLSSDPQASQAVSWQVPLRTPEPPGIDADRLPK